MAAALHRVFARCKVYVVVEHKAATAVANFVGKGYDSFAADGPCTSLMLLDGVFEACSRFGIVAIVVVAVVVVGSV